MAIVSWTIAAPVFRLVFDQAMAGTDPTLSANPWAFLDALGVVPTLSAFNLTLGGVRANWTLTGSPTLPVTLTVPPGPSSLMTAEGGQVPAGVYVLT